MANTCPECGAVLSAGNTCQAIFDEFLVLEYTDPSYGKVHMLTVACFMIQHHRYSDEALAWIEDQLQAYLEAGMPVEQIRQHAAKETGPGQRTWKVTRQPNARRLPEIPWSLTIADVAAHYQDAGSYCEWVERWARVTLTEMKPFLPGFKRPAP